MLKQLGVRHNPNKAVVAGEDRPFDKLPSCLKELGSIIDRQPLLRIEMHGMGVQAQLGLLLERNYVPLPPHSKGRL